jgi:hypothetical protein
MQRVDRLLRGFLERAEERDDRQLLLI